jgi:hypothetical protein
MDESINLGLSGLNLSAFNDFLISLTGHHFAQSVLVLINSVLSPISVETFHRRSHLMNTQLGLRTACVEDNDND